MATIDSLLDHVMPKAPGLSVEMARLEIRQAAIQFCRRSEADRRKLVAFNTVVGTAFYPLTLPADTAVSAIVAVSIDGELPGIDPIRQVEIPSDAETLTARPAWYSADDGGARLQLVYAPDATYSVVVTVALEPSDTTSNINDWIARRHGQAIAFGALEALLAMPKKPWTDVGMAAYYKGRFDSAILEAKSSADQGFTAAAARTRSCFGLR